MIGKHRPSRRFATGKAITGVTVALVLLAVLVFAQFTSAAQGGGPTTPPPAPYMEETDFSKYVPSEAERATMSPIERYLAGQSLPNAVLDDADLSGSSKTASAEEVSPGANFSYTIDIVNSGDFDITAVMTDTLPAEVIYLDHDCSEADECNVENGALVWEGLAAAGETVSLSIQVRMKSDAVPGTVVSNTAQIVSADDQVVEVTADVTVGAPKSSPFQFLPYTVFMPSPSTVTLAAGQPNSGNTWNLSWTKSAYSDSYEYQEADNPNFTDATSFIVGAVNSVDVTREPSPSNVYYYRVRGLKDGGPGNWSNVVSVVGGYYDQFEDNGTGWSMRRSTYREKVNGFYENNKYVMQVIDKWDWGLSSPLMPAPRLPYAIDFEMKAVNTANLLSAGMVFAGDWNGQTCPPGLGYYEWYDHKDCFNHFYNTNMIFYGGGGLKMLFERVDKLVFCPDCDGSAIKRLGDLDPKHNVKDITHIDPEGWNHFRIEVREDSIKVFAGKRGSSELHFQFQYNDTRWVDSPYFGFFASTDEYNNSTWRYEYMKVMPLDN